MEPDFKIFSTQQWGARKISRVFTVERPMGIVVHHTAGPNRTPQSGSKEEQESFELCRSIQKFHMDDNGWADTGQHFTVTRGGLVLEGRTGSLLNAAKGFVPRGAHAGDNEGNAFYFGIEVEGINVDAFNVTDKQWKALVELCAWLSASGEFQSQNIKGHNQFASTACPGKIMGKLPELRKLVRERKLELMEGVHA